MSISFLATLTNIKLFKLFSIHHQTLNSKPSLHHSKVLQTLSIKDLWPIWINEYTNLKTWTDKHAYQRRYALGEKYIFPIIGSHKPNQISIRNIVDCLELAMQNTQQTHLKVLIALSQFLRWSTAKQLRDPNNRLPTDIELIEPYLGSRLRKPCGHHPSVDWRDIPLFISLLVKETSISAKALLFTILTASRLQSVCQAQWNEINFLLKEWQIPSSHMKGKQGHNRPHEVLLSFQATKLLYSLTPPGSNGTGNLIFSATGNELSGTALRKLIRKLDKVALERGHRGFRDPLQNNRVAVTHGFRASFATWAQETGQDMSVVERCLSHIDPSDRYHGAYRRGQMISQRKKLLQEWADYCYSAVEPPCSCRKTPNVPK
jgi:integrase